MRAAALPPPPALTVELNLTSPSSVPSPQMDLREISCVLTVAIEFTVMPATESSSPGSASACASATLSPSSSPMNARLTSASIVTLVTSSPSSST
eukprot:CAMPEP_0119525188 /NCGR_PEP_ID=MMETSP1344-20130328/40030_1 /TAXON_ID=236787 /ORGANISM="Florenciella parvula, Strain CCMP2471" /LENGTH=94 /DNA_ID=CAMNT_0007563903 /DNA_START=340 /DNA_END=621 /DNA_ORIENTATION=+